MHYRKMVLVFGLMLISSLAWGQDTLAHENIPTLNRIAGEYDRYKQIFSIVAGVLILLTPLGFWVLLKTKAEEWVLNKIAKEAGLKVEHVKSAVGEFAHIAELKKKKILVISAADGQQDNVKKVFSKCGFAYGSGTWVNISGISTHVLVDADVLLFNDQIEFPLSEVQIESTIQKFKTNVGYFYFGDKQLPSKEYRQKYQIDLDFCNSATRLEAGLLSLLKIR